MSSATITTKTMTTTIITTTTSLLKMTLYIGMYSFRCTCVAKVKNKLHQFILVLKNV